MKSLSGLPFSSCEGARLRNGSARVSNCTESLGRVIIVTPWLAFVNNSRNPRQQHVRHNLRKNTVKTTRRAILYYYRVEMNTDLIATESTEEHEKIKTLQEFFREFRGYFVFSLNRKLSSHQRIPHALEAPADFSGQCGNPFFLNQRQHRGRVHERNRDRTIVLFTHNHVAG